MPKTVPQNHRKSFSFGIRLGAYSVNWPWRRSSSDKRTVRISATPLLSSEILWLWLAIVFRFPYQSFLIGWYCIPDPHQRYRAFVFFEESTRKIMDEVEFAIWWQNPIPEGVRKISCLLTAVYLHVLRHLCHGWITLSILKVTRRSIWRSICNVSWFFVELLVEKLDQKGLIARCSSSPREFCNCCDFCFCLLLLAFSWPWSLSKLTCYLDQRAVRRDSGAGRMLTSVR